MFILQSVSLIIAERKLKSSGYVGQHYKSSNLLYFGFLPTHSMFRPGLLYEAAYTRLKHLELGLVD